MKFTINQKVLAEGLKAVKGLVGKNVSNPILAGILVDATESEIKLTSGDGNNFISYCIDISEQEDCKVEEPGAVVWNKTVVEIVSKYKSSTLSFVKNDKDFTAIKSGADEFEVAGFSAGEYPTLPNVTAESSEKINGDVFKKLIKRTAFAASQSETRPILQGIHIDFQSEGIICTSTDSHRMGKVKVPSSNENEKAFVIKADYAKEMIRVFDSANEVECLLESDNQLVVKSENVIFYTRLLDGNYPDTSRLIPDGFESKIIMDRDELIEAVDKILILTKSASTSINGIKLTPDEKEADLFSGADGTQKVISLSAAQQDVGKGNSSVRVKEIEGEEPKELAFDGRYLMEALNAIDTEEVSICFNGNMRPFLVMPKHDDGTTDTEELQLILPIRVA